MAQTLVNRIEMSKIGRQDPKKRWKSEDFRKQAKQKVFFNQRDKRHALVSKLRALNDAEKNELIANLLEDGLRMKEIENRTSDEVPSYESVFIRNLDWEEFLCTEEYADLYNEIENALQSEALNWTEEPSEVDYYDENNHDSSEFSPEDFTMDQETSEEVILCPICWRRNLDLQSNSPYSYFHCPGCSSFISMVTQDGARNVSPVELKQSLARSYDRYLQHRDLCHPSDTRIERRIIFQLDDNYRLNAICSQCSLMEPVIS